MDDLAQLIVGNVMSTPAITIDLDASLDAAHTLLEQRHIRHVAVTEHGHLIGILSDRDLLRHLSPFIGTLSERQQDLSTLRRHVHQIMTRNPFTTHRDASLKDALAILLQHRISCLPVLDPHDQLVGMITLRDMLAALARHFEPAS